jgi:hypothetical protein
MSDEQTFPVGSAAYYVDGRRVPRREYVEHLRDQQRQEALDLLRSAGAAVEQQPVTTEE